MATRKKNETKRAEGRGLKAEGQKTEVAATQQTEPKTATPAINMGARVLVDLPVAAIIPTPENPRVLPDGHVVGEDQPKFIELFKSIQANGVIEPVHVRKHPTEHASYDLRDGARRWRAAQIAGMEKIPAFLYTEMSDLAACLMTMLQTLGREDLTPIQESVTVATLLERCNGDVDAAAAYTGHTPQWVRLRARLQALSPGWQKAMNREITPDNGWEFANTWGVGHYELLARLDENVQEVLWAEFRHKWGSEKWAVKDLEKYLAKEVMHLLVSTSWPKDDATLLPKGAGACVECQKRSSCTGQRELFHDGETPEVIAKRDQCTDKACWAARADAWTQANIKTMQKQYPKLQLVATQHPDYYEAQEITRKHGGKVQVMDNAKACKAETPGAVPSLVVHGPDKGELKWFKPETAARQTATGHAAGPKPLAEKRETLDSKRWASVIEVIRERLEVIKFSELPAHTLPDLLKLVQGFGTDNARLDSDWKTFDAKVDTAVLAEQVWRLVTPEMSDAMNYSKPTEVHAGTIETTKRIAGLLGMEPDPMFAAAKQRLPDPKSWKKQAEEEAAKAEKKTAKSPKKSKPKGKGKPADDRPDEAVYECEACHKIAVTDDEKDGWPSPDQCPECEEEMNAKEDAENNDEV